MYRCTDVQLYSTLYTFYRNCVLPWTLSRPGPQFSTSRALTRIRCKLGKQYLEKKFTLPWESNPGPTPIRGDPATLVASAGLIKIRIKHFLKGEFEDSENHSLSRA